jgi:hypothetical protein
MNKEINKSWGEAANEVFYSVSSNNVTLPSAVYSPGRMNDGTYVFKKQTIKTDELISFAGSVSDKIVSEIQDFWSDEVTERFVKYNVLHRRGYLLYGQPGSGKTAIVEQIIAATLKNNGVAFQCRCNPLVFANALAIFREQEPTRKVVALFEDIDSIIETYSEAELLAYLDGETQIDHVLNIATTNYPEKLNKRIINRPRRFDAIIKIACPEASLRQKYFVTKLKITEAEAKVWTDKTDGFSFAGMTDLVINVKCFGYDLDVSVEKVKNTLLNTASSEDDVLPATVAFDDDTGDEITPTSTKGSGVAVIHG